MHPTASFQRASVSIHSHPWATNIQLELERFVNQTKHRRELMLSEMDR
jgi:hypothetical protein